MQLSKKIYSVLQLPTPPSPSCCAGRHVSRPEALLHFRSLHASWVRDRDHICLRAQVLRSQELYEVADAVSTLKSAITLGASAGILVSLAWSTLPLVATQPEGKRRGRPVDGQEADEVKWGAMTVISFLPLFNWLAWIFAALDKEDRASFYYILAALYAVPQLSAGFEQDWVSIATLIAGIAHVQAERIADERGVAQPFRFKAEVGDSPAKASKMLSSSARAFADAVQDRNDRKTGFGKQEEEDDYVAEELQKWDDQFESRSRDKKKT